MIEIPLSMKRAPNVVHVSKRKPYHTSPGEKRPLSIKIDTDGTTEDSVSAVFEKHQNRTVSLDSTFSS